MFSTIDRSLESSKKKKKKSIREYELCILEKKEYTLCFRCCKRQMSTILVEEIRLFKVTDALKGLDLFFGDLSKCQSKIVLKFPATIRFVFARSGILLKVLQKKTCIIHIRTIYVHQRNMYRVKLSCYNQKPAIIITNSFFVLKRDFFLLKWLFFELY